MHSSRRKLGHVSTNSSSSDIRKAGGTVDPSRPRHPQNAMRKSTQALPKRGKSPRDREREYESEQWPDDERESFPQFCMTCEKQFIAQDDRFLYCSEACRKNDLTPTTSHSSFKAYGSYHSTVPSYASDHSEIRDIIPRASPSRPSSNHFSPPTTPTSPQYPSAISALRSLNIRPPSPPSSFSMSASIWPFTRSAANSPNPSYITNMCPSTYDGAHVASAYTHTDSGMTSSDRPLPSRGSPAYSRPKSIALVTPMMSHY